MGRKQNCSVIDCDSKSRVYGMCGKHHMRVKRYGNPYTVLRVPNDTPICDRFWDKVAITSNPECCWEWTASLNKAGYGTIAVGDTVKRAHRVAWFLTHGCWPTQLVLHSCDNPRCVNPQHLREGTAYENTHDMISRGRHSYRYGKDAGSAKLIDEKVLQINRLLKRGVLQKDIADLYNVGDTTVCNIKYGNTWKHLLGKETNTVILDVDGVLCNFTEGIIHKAKELGFSEFFPLDASKVNHWNISSKFSEVFDVVKHDPEFWLSLTPMITELPFSPIAYLTARPIDSKITEQWLQTHGFPKAKIITVSDPDEKLEYIKKLNPDAFIDDYFVTIKQIRNADANGILFKQPYQRGHKKECKGLPVIKTLGELKNYV